MKKETTANKLMALLGIQAEVPDEFKSEQTKKKQAKNYERDIAIDESEIENFRAMQGVIYYLQAPELFTAKVCKHCSADFLVSRKFVGYCSFTCIKASLEDLGMAWRKGDDLDALISERGINSPYDGNMPIWVRNTDKLKHALEVLNASLDKLHPETGGDSPSLSGAENITGTDSALARA